jgi:hypothetical protein
LDKHTRPYSCGKCSRVNFPDKAGLQRHMKEKHGPLTEKFLCHEQTCPRHRRGFSRKRNLESHVRVRHEAPTSIETGAGLGANGTSAGDSFVSPGSSHIVEQTVDSQGDNGGLGASTEMERHKLKLMELELRQKGLEVCQREVDDDIQAVRRTMGLLFS